MAATDAGSMHALKEPNCSIARSLEVLGERWTFLILREAFSGATRFAEFRDALGVAPDVLTDRLSSLVDYGVLAREPYQEPGARSRFAYRLTPAGWDLRVVLGALQQWGDAYLPRPGGPTMAREASNDGRPLRVGFVDDEGREVGLDNIAFIRTPAYPAPALTAAPSGLFGGPHYLAEAPASASRAAGSASPCGLPVSAGAPSALSGSRPAPAWAAAARRSPSRLARRP